MDRTWLTVEQAARVLGRSTESIRRMVNRHPGDVARKHAEDGYRYQVAVEDVRRLVEEIGR